MNSRIVIGLLVIGGFLALALSALFFSVGTVQEPPGLRAFCDSSIDKIDTLNHPMQVKQLESGGLVLTTGRLVTLPGIKTLPVTSSALTEVTSHGIELDPEGRVFGLVRVWHWCGNDPVRTHLARVDVARLLMYLGEGSFPQPSVKPPTWASTKERFTKEGWDVGDFSQFVAWNRELEAELRRQSRPSNAPLNSPVPLRGPAG